MLTSKCVPSPQGKHMPGPTNEFCVWCRFAIHSAECSTCQGTGLQGLNAKLPGGFCTDCNAKGWTWVAESR